MRSAVAAVTFLTAVPLGRGQVRESELRAGSVLFPLVGALVGLVVASVAWAASLVLPPLVAGALGAASGVLVTGALHLDGLADVADGIGAGLTGRDPSSVMHDPRLGTFGGAALALDLVLKVSVIAGLVGGERFPFEIVAAAALARVAPLALAAVLPYARSSGAGGWTGGIGVGSVIVGLALASAIGIWSAGAAFGAMVLVGALATAFLGWWSARHLVGVTGDVFGAAAELTETLALTVALAFL